MDFMSSILPTADNLGLMAENAREKGQYGKWSTLGMQGAQAPNVSQQSPLGGLQGLLSLTQGGGVGGTQLPNSRGGAPQMQAPQLSQPAMGGLPWASLFGPPQTQWTPKQIQSTLPYLLTLGKSLSQRGK